MDKVTVCSLALARLGEREYREGSATFLPCEKWYGVVLRLAAGMYNWTFTKRRARLRRKEGVGEEGEAWYEYPVDCLKLVRFVGAGGKELREVRLYGGGICVAEEEAGEELVVDYQSDLVHEAGELPDRRPEFCEGVVCLLASRIAMEVSGKGQLAGALAQEAEVWFTRALENDRQQDWGNANCVSYAAGGKRSRIARGMFLGED